jgi:hypothetical protein
MKRRDFVKTLATSFMAPGLLLSQHTLAADIAFGRHEAWEPINSVFANRDRGPAQTRADPKQPDQLRVLARLDWR